jgi:hypothetical protein
MPAWFVPLIVIAASIIIFVWAWRKFGGSGEPGVHGKGIDDEIATAVENVVEMVFEDPDKHPHAIGGLSGRSKTNGSNSPR